MAGAVVAALLTRVYRRAWNFVANAALAAPMLTPFVTRLPRPYVHVFACMFVALSGYVCHWVMG